MTRHLAIASLLVAFAATAASADTLREALVSTYQANPTLTGQREALKATDAGVAIARSAGRPNVTGTVGVTRDLTRSGRFDTGLSKGPFVVAGVDVNMPLYQGGTVKNDIKAAKSRVEAGRATLRAVEGDIFTEAVSAYMEVIRTRATTELNVNNVKVLETNLQATQDRFEIGDVTRTDVAQSEARLSLARTRLVLTQGNQVTAEENYRRVIGKAPGQLQPPPPLPPLPRSPDEAVRIALVNNPDLLASNHQVDASGYDVKSIRGTRLPTVSAIASGDFASTTDGDTAGIDRSGTATSIGVQGRIPLYQGGLPGARIRQAQAREGQALEFRIASERQVVANTRSAYADYQAAVDGIKSSEVAVKANELALEGVRAENSVGTRTILDVLDAEQELLNSQVVLVTARRDAYVAGFQLLNAMGQAEADDLGLDGGPLYDPLGNYRRVAGDWNDWSNDPRHNTVATSTVTPQEQPQGVTPAAQ
ncbi:TolC family outer membrane protein [Sphingomonas sp. RB56-2]|uniref:TolC family outer membrane protein n=1 Tax=Sphingomonas brevis TaxID=2908206 RepID=A0ABT0S8Z1_9SPHN|nr:TolC family outer membrane protein [Sphingomonas brevis]